MFDTKSDEPTSDMSEYLFDLQETEEGEEEMVIPLASNLDKKNVESITCKL